MAERHPAPLRRFAVVSVREGGMTDSKRSNGQYFTARNPFRCPAFLAWAERLDLPRQRILEPFAGANDIIRSLQDLELCTDFASYDIRPAHDQVRPRDTLREFPSGFAVCVTNPPWLARNSATRRGLPFPDCRYDNMYKHCLELCLRNCAHVAALLPASFLQSGLFRHRLQAYVLLHAPLFRDTENPVCLALFGSGTSADADIHYDNEFIGTLTALEQHCPRGNRDRHVRFNDPAGALGFVSFDNTRGRSIRFCPADEIAEHEIKVSSRFITRISGDLGDVSKLVVRLNGMLDEYRDATRDLFLTPFKGIRDDGQYRRRMFFSQARRFVDAARAGPG